MLAIIVFVFAVGLVTQSISAVFPRQSMQRLYFIRKFADPLKLSSPIRRRHCLLVLPWSLHPPLIEPVASSFKTESKPDTGLVSFPLSRSLAVEVTNSRLLHLDVVWYAKRHNICDIHNPICGHRCHQLLQCVDTSKYDLCVIVGYRRTSDPVVQPSSRFSDCNSAEPEWDCGGDRRGDCVRSSLCTARLEMELD